MTMPQTLTGKGAYYVRKSTKKQEEATQIEAVASWLTSRSKDIKDVEAFEDTGSRHKAHKRVDFQRLLKWVEAGELQWIVVAELDRFGSSDPYQLMSFIHQLRQSNCSLWVAADNKCVSEGDDLTILTNVMNGMKSEKEQYTRSARALRSFPDLASRGAFTGGRIPFAFDIECRRGDKILWHFTPEIKGGILLRDGKTEPVPKQPVHDHRIGERTYLVPSIRPDRIEALRFLFNTFATEAVSFSGLARRLNSRGLSTGGYDKWTFDRIIYILGNPVYSLGYRPVGRTTQSQFHRHEISGQGVRTIGIAPDKTGKKVPRPESEWITSTPTFEPLVDPSIFVKVKAKIESQKTVRAPRSDRHWLSGIVICDKCGQRMYSWNQQKKNREGERFIVAYRCRAADRASQGKEDNKSQCQRHIVRQDVLIPYIEDFLKQRGESLDRIIEAKGDRRNYEKLVKQKSHVGRLLEEINEGIYSTVYDYLHNNGALTYRDEEGDHTVEARDVLDYPMEFELQEFREMFNREPSIEFDDRVEGNKVWTPCDTKFIFVDGKEEQNDWTIDQLYERIHSFALISQSGVIDDKEREFEALVGNFGKLSNPRAREIANATIEALDEEIKKLRSRLDNLTVKWATTADEYRSLSDRVKEARVALELGTDSQKADAARRLFKEIRLSFTYTKHKCTTRSHLSTVAIIPLLGDSSTTEVNSRSSAWRFQQAQLLSRLLGMEWFRTQTGSLQSLPPTGKTCAQSPGR